MSPVHELRWRGTVAGCFAWTLVVSAVAYPICVAVADEHQGFVVRVAAALIFGIVLLQIHKGLRGELEGAARSRFDLAQETWSHTATIDRHFVELEKELQHSLKSRQYFDRVLWPRLLALGEREKVILKPPPLRWPATRGPQFSDVAEIVSHLEHKS